MHLVWRGNGFILHSRLFSVSQDAPHAESFLKYMLKRCRVAGAQGANGGQSVSPTRLLRFLLRGAPRLTLRPSCSDGMDMQLKPHDSKCRAS